MPNALYSKESLSRYLKSGYVIESENDELAILVKRRKVGTFWNLILTLITGGVWLLVWIPRFIFRNSVVRLYKDEIPAKQTGWLSGLANLGIVKFQALSSRGKLITSGAVAILLVFFFISGNVSQNNEENLAKAANYATHQELLETPVEPAYCGALERILETGAAVTFAKKNQTRATKASNSLTEWNADAYLVKSDWVVPASKLMLDFEVELEGSSNKLLAARINALKDRSAQVGLNELDGTWGDSFRLFAIEDCGLGDKASKAKNQISEVSAAASVIQVKASSKPWYPKGFEEVSGYPGFAYLNISNQGCSYSFGSCAKFKIVSQTGCPKSLYVETNLESGGAVVDWSNDTARGLGANQVAIMETNFSSEGSGNWRIVDLSCY